MTANIYRSLGFDEKTKWGYPLHVVEVITRGDDFDILLYDVGFEPPYYDLAKPFSYDPFEKTRMKGGLKGANEFLKEKSIFVDAWRQVRTIYARESNALIRPDIRIDVTDSSFYEEGDIIVQAKPAIAAIKELQQYSGHSADVKVKFVAGGRFLTFSNTLYLMFRTAAEFGAWGFVAKGSRDNISLLIEVRDKLVCKLYNQSKREVFQHGAVVDLVIDFITAPSGFKLSINEFKKYKPPDVTIMRFD